MIAFAPVIVPSSSHLSLTYIVIYTVNVVLRKRKPSVRIARS